MKCFFSASSQAIDNITEMFNVLSTMRVALWNLRCSVKGVLSEYPTASHEFLNRKFTEGSDVAALDYKASIFHGKWKEQQDDIAWLMLGWLVSIYEGWLQHIHDEIVPKMDIKEMQFGCKIRGELERLNKDKSSITNDCFYAVYSNSPKARITKLENMLLCYRVFKEMRNCYMHHRRRVNEHLFETYEKFCQTINDPKDIHAKEIPIVHPITRLGEQIKISLRGVIGFSDIIICMISTIDAELIKGQHAEEWLKKILKENGLCNKSISTKKQVAHQQILSFVKKCGIERQPHQRDVLVEFVKKYQLDIL